MNITNEFGGLTKITFESFEKSLFKKIAENAKRKIKPKDRTIDSRSMTITVNQYVAKEFLETTRAIRDIGQESFVGDLDSATTTETVVDGKEQKPKKHDSRMAPPLPKGEHYSMYDVPKEGQFRYCYTCTHYFSTDEAYEFHVRAGHHVRTIEEWKDIQEIARRVDANTTGKVQ